MRSKIYQEEVSSFALEVYETCQQYPLMFIDEDEGFAYFVDFIEQRFDKFWPNLYDGEYRNYN
jgi:hypothetical protein